MGEVWPSVSEAELRSAEAGLVVGVGRHGLRYRLRLAEHFRGHVAGCDLAQGEHGRLVVLQGQRRLGAVGEPAGALRRQQHQLEQVVDVLQAVFYGDSGPGGAQSARAKTLKEGRRVKAVRPGAPGPPPTPPTP